jgi:hypothetical protein
MSLEIGLIVAGLLGSFTMCAVKIIHQIQNSKCVFIDCMCMKCVRDPDINLDEADTSQQSRSQATQTQTSPPPPPAPPPPTPVPRPRLSSEAVSALRAKYECN